MKQSNNLRMKEIFPGSYILRNFSFKTIETRDSSALLVRENKNLSMGYDRLGENCSLFTAILPIQVDTFALLRGKSVLFQIKDCFECLSPQLMVA